jgi:hypothetical protein
MMLALQKKKSTYASQEENSNSPECICGRRLTPESASICVEIRHSGIQATGRLQVPTLYLTHDYSRNSKQNSVGNWEAGSGKGVDFAASLLINGSEFKS